LLAADRGYPAGAVNRGRFLLVTFLGKTRKVISCRATPGGVDFDCWVALHSHLTKLANYANQVIG
jgi:hypothetical protein